MTILFPYMARWYSAHASRYYHLLMSTAELGHKIIVVQPPSRHSGEANDIDTPLATHPNVEVITVPFNERFWRAHFPLEKLIKKFLFTLRSVPLVKRLQRDRSVDLLYLYNIPQFVYLFGKRPRVVFDFADDLLGMLETELNISPRHPLYRLAAWGLHWIVRRSDIVICISGPLFDKVHHNNKHIIPNGANVERMELRGEQGVNERGKREAAHLTVGYVGAFEYSMALDQAIQAAEHLPEVHFVLVGAGREYPRIAKVVAEKGLANVHLTGALPHAEAMAQVRAMDICLNLFERTAVSHAVSPLKLFEYLSFHKPVISTRLHEVERINSEDFLYFADTVDEIVENIRYITEHPEDAAFKAERGYRAVVERFSWPRIAGQFVRAVGTPQMVAETAANPLVR